MEEQNQGQGGQEVTLKPDTVPQETFSKSADGFNKITLEWFFSGKKGMMLRISEKSMLPPDDCMFRGIIDKAKDLGLMYYMERQMQQKQAEPKIQLVGSDGNPMKRGLIGAVGAVKKKLWH